MILHRFQHYFVLVFCNFIDRFNAALDTQPRWYTLQQNSILWFGYTCITIGTVLVFTSFYALGYYGTFLGKCTFTVVTFSSVSEKNLSYCDR